MRLRERHAFYRAILRALSAAEIPHLIGGAFAMKHYAGVERDTKDLDVFIKRDRAEEVVKLFRRRGYAARIVARHWLGKIRKGDAYVDLIFSSRNGICVVDDAWFERAEAGRYLGLPTNFVPPEEMIWSKAFVMARDRFDGADISQIIRARGRSLDWRIVLERFGENWEILLVHVALFTYTFPSERDAVPAWVRAELERRWRRDRGPRLGDRPICRGPLLSPPEFTKDVGRRGYLDIRRPEVKADSA
ncbi:MAG TPA: hypothetical protein VEJ18_04495 [Planctomycetota bacterium]|nr:hypothetical protein [Planctomycetota bacterium]